MVRLGNLRRLGAKITALVLSALVCAGSANLGHKTWDDPSCDPLPVHHDHNAHRFQSGRLPIGPADDHCVLCHSLRSLVASAVATPLAFGTSASVGVVRQARPGLAGRLLGATATPRAPPSALL
jgi:hypothetical protein